MAVQMLCNIYQADQWTNRASHMDIIGADS